MTPDDPTTHHAHPPFAAPKCIGTQVLAPRTLPLAGRRTLLRPIEPPDYDHLYWLACSAHTAFRTRSRGEGLSFSRFRGVLWNKILVQFVIEDRARPGKLIGLVFASQANFRDQTAFMGCLLDPAVEGEGWPLEGPALFISYLFEVFPFRKILLEVLEFNFGPLASGLGRYFEEEGRLEQYAFYDDRFWDLHLLAVWRDAWERLADRLGVSLRERPSIIPEPEA